VNTDMRYFVTTSSTIAVRLLRQPWQWFPTS